MYTGNPYNDAILHINWLDSLPTAVDEEACDLCEEKHDRFIMVATPDKMGYYCGDCVKSNDVEKFLKQSTDLTPWQIKNYLNLIKTKI